MQVWGTVEVRTGFWRETLLEKRHLEDLGVNGMAIFKWVLIKRDGRHELE